MKPYYTRVADNNQAGLFDGYEEDSKVEVEFIKYLDKAKQVKWWFKNGYGEVHYFAVSYINKYGKKSAFYVDFVIQLSNGRVALVDTKAGRTAENADTKEKAEGLAKYIKEEKKKGKELFGGIVILVEGNWRYNDRDKYSYNPKDLKGWKFLDLN